MQFEEFILFGYEEYQSRRCLGNLGDPLGRSRDNYKLQAHAKMIRTHKYLKAKATTIALNALQQLF